MEYKLFQDLQGHRQKCLLLVSGLTGLLINFCYDGVRSQYRAL